MTTERFPIWLARQLDRRNWSQTDLAKKVGTNSSVVSRWVRGERIPSTRSVEKIAEAFDVDPDYVLAISGHRPNDLDDEDELKEELVAMIEAHPKPVSDRLIIAIRSILELDAAGSGDQSR